MNVAVDLKEVKQQEELFRFFKESFDYLMNKYEYFKLPVAMFDEKQLEFIKENYFVKVSKDKRYYYVMRKV